MDLVQEPVHPVAKTEHHVAVHPAPHHVGHPIESHHLQPKSPKKPEPKKEEPKPAPPQHYGHRKLTDKEIEQLRVEHGIKYEHEHSVDHFIDHLTHPHYEITGYIDGQTYSHDAQIMDMFAHDHEEEVFGDEYDDLRPHLHLQPKRHDYRPHTISVDKPYYAGEHHYRDEHGDVLPRGEDHWVDVHHEAGDFHHEHDLSWQHHTGYRRDVRPQGHERYEYHAPAHHDDHREQHHERVVEEGVFYGDEDHMMHRDEDGYVSEGIDDSPPRHYHEKIIHEDVFVDGHDSHPVTRRHVEYEEPSHSKYEHYYDDDHHDDYEYGHDTYDYDDGHSYDYSDHHDDPVDEWTSYDYDHGDAYRTHHTSHDVYGGYHDDHYEHQDDHYQRHDVHRPRHSDHEVAPLYDLHFDGHTATWHPDHEHVYHEHRHDLEPVAVHETIIEHVPDLYDHRAYHIEDSPNYHHMDPPHLSHGHFDHGSPYQFHHEEWMDQLPSRFKKR